MSINIGLLKIVVNLKIENKKETCKNFSITRMVMKFG